MAKAKSKSKAKGRAKGRSKRIFRSDMSLTALLLAAGVGVWFYMARDSEFDALVVGLLCFAVVSLEWIKPLTMTLDTLIRAGAKVALELIRQSGNFGIEYLRTQRMMHREAQITERATTMITGRRQNERQRGDNALVRQAVQQAKRRSGPTRRLISDSDSLPMPPVDTSDIEQIINGEFTVMPREW